MTTAVKSPVKIGNRYIYNVLRDGKVVAHAVPYQYGQGYQVRVRNEPDDMNLAGMIHLGICQLSDIPATADKLLDLVALARKTADPTEFFLGMRDHNLHAGWPFSRIKEFIKLVGTLPAGE